MNIKKLTMTSIDKLSIYRFESTRDHSKWAITDNSSIPWTCIGDLNRGVS